MKIVTAASPVVPDAAPRQTAPPQYDSVSHAHRVQNYDLPAWQDTSYTACFLFDSKSPSDGAADPESEWEARLRVKSRDLPRLMREGFHWTPANFDPGATYIQKDLSGEKKTIKRRWTQSRNFFLSDLSDNPYWAATLVIYARSTRVLSRFKVTDVTPDTMSWAAAWKKDEHWGNVHWIYEWDCRRPQESYNAVYGEMPLDGWWPWPKRAVNDIPPECGSVVGRQNNEV
ncbi:hypothetical protein CH063_02113 [Colletotrichum higginsianum]|uniref:Short chain dehydrogenase reductase family n=1 Tax=Colletotrichum higginsianum (strain IMI 349063) TaxID=759273 RepID=H1VGJ6_COLHI|nr:Short chain dehydrogenase reductase family [Colletotrichum higginsianum IMI 349063]OBR14595.1 Short chain dehydrogenase reductase family [Colletotrichum higginsianum IMI 349063]CCF39349.1 hypothetical protein CH063_02113 [Colletotrichum higginsianum]